MDRILNRYSAEVDAKEAAERLPPDNEARWAKVWADSGIKLGAISLEGFMGEPRARANGHHGTFPEGFAVAGDHGLGIGDIVALRDAERPTEANQFLVRVSHVRPAKGGGSYVSFDAPLPRSEWPAPMREATVPTSIYVEPVLDLGQSCIEVIDGSGKVLWGAGCDPGSSGELADRMERAVRNAADLGHADAFTGRRRSFGILAGLGGPDRDQKAWQMADGLGGIADIEPRGRFERRPSTFAKALLAVTTAAYVEGIEEGLARKAGLELKAAIEHDEVPALSM